MDQTLVIVATLTAKPGHGATLKAALETVVPPSRAEAGCHRYDLHADNGNPDSFVMLEEWRDAAALTEHESTPHFQALVAAVGGIAEIHISKLTQIA